MKAYKDGNAICVTLDDFTDLAASPAVFVDGELAEEIEKARFDLRWVDSDKINPIIARLVTGDDADQIVKLPEYQVFFVIHDEYLKQFENIIHRKESLGGGVTACWSIVTSDIGVGDFYRKGSVSVDGYFIHDDYRAGGDCVVFRMKEVQK